MRIDPISLVNWHDTNSPRKGADVKPRRCLKCQKVFNSRFGAYTCANCQRANTKHRREDLWA